ncbi:hypothetical protein RND81_02G090100 [Saponaria officinalis]|uniref:Uncharacterized protein n=1 Tax=Saponaria officinalis TaxID=3572 RepID=A0AAW1MSJ0_SAPOF
MSRIINGEGDAMWPAIGIDLGTKHSCVGVWQHDCVEIILNEQGNRRTPSCVAFTETELLVGDAAESQAAVNPTNTIFDAKKLIGRKFTDKVVQSDIKLWPFKVLNDPMKGDKPMIEVSYKGEVKHFSAEGISSIVLMRMKETAEAYLGTKVKGAVITVPAFFNDSQRQATKEAATIAGLNVMQIIDEPTAAAIAYSFERKTVDNNGKRNVLVFDLGGRTLNVSLMVLDKSSYEVKAVNGGTHLGGVDFNNIMMKHFVEEFQSKHNKDISDNPRSLGRLRAACETTKWFLSEALHTITEIDWFYDGIHFSSEMSRAIFERFNIDLFKYCLTPVEQCLRDAMMRKEDVDEIILIGGSTRIPKVEQLLKDFFNGKRLFNDLNVVEAVASGAAIHAAFLSGVLQNQRYTLMDVPSLSLGVEINDGDTTDIEEDAEDTTDVEEDTEDTTDVEEDAEDMTDIRLLLKSVDSLLESFGDSKPAIKPFPPHMKRMVVKILTKLKQNISDTNLLKILCGVLREVNISIPEHLRTTLRGLEQTVIASQRQLLDRVAEKEAACIDPQVVALGNSDLITSKKRIISSSANRDRLKADIADVNATIAGLMEKRASLERDLASEESILVGLTDSLATEMESARMRRNRITSFQNAEKLEDEARRSLGIAVDCLAKFFESL